jgi:hypothetical protein
VIGEDASNPGLWPSRGVLYRAPRGSLNDLQSDYDDSESYKVNLFKLLR